MIADSGVVIGGCGVAQSVFADGDIVNARSVGGGSGVCSEHIGESVLAQSEVKGGGGGDKDVGTALPIARRGVGVDKARNIKFGRRAGEADSHISSARRQERAPRKRRSRRAVIGVNLGRENGTLHAELICRRTRPNPHLTV